MNKEEFEIFSRQLILKEFNEDSFSKLQLKKVSIVGLGGIGCPVAQYLISSGIKNLKIFDDDIIKKHNLNRQGLYTLDDINKKKTVVAKKKLLKINPHAYIKKYNERIEINNLSLLEDSSIIIDASDNWKTMKLINSYASKNNIPLLSASAVGFSIQIALFENKKNQHLCLECIFPNKHEPDISRCDQVGILGTTAGLAGIISAQKTINYFMKLNSNTEFLTLIDSKEILITNIKIKKNISCKLK
ncbi:HesA/MoeB/ThiF family protein [Alphaproteobacteria bacterium]|nr:HesA/MoeB/ThiF family protein [Alphaproteobacteria bacterium]